MKRLLALALAALTTVTLAADSPEAILKDYRAKAETALAKTNKVLETEAATLAASLLRAGATADAEALTTQVKQKVAGEPLPSPTPVAANLFKQYDTARAAALKPVQDQFIARIDALTHTSAGQQVAVVGELAKVRAEIENGLSPTQGAELDQKLKFPSKWNYYADVNSSPIAIMEFHPNGTYTLIITSNGKKEDGTWKQKEKSVLSLTGSGSTWDMNIDLKDQSATMWRPDSGRRYLKAASP